MNTTLNTLKNYTDNEHWTVVCGCKRCAHLPWIKLPLEHMASFIDRAGIDFSKDSELGKLNHEILQASK